MQAGKRGDIHAISMDGHGYYTEVPHWFPKPGGKRNPVSKKVLDGHYFNGERKLLCCCQLKEVNYDEKGHKK